MALPPGLRRRGRMFYVQWRDDTGKWRSTSVGPNLAIALQRLAELRREKPQEPGPVLSDVVPPWLEAQATRCKPRSVQISRQRAKGLLRHLGSVRVADLTSERLDDFIRLRRTQGVKDTSINGDLTTLRQLVRYAEHVGLVDHAPRVKLLRVVRKKRRRILHSDDIAKLLRAADQRPGRPEVGRKVKAFILIAASTGMRMEEILHLQWQDVDFEDRRFDVRAKEWTQRRGLHIQRCSWSPKSHNERSMWAESSLLFDFLKDYRETQKRNGPADWVFQGHRPGRRLTTIFKALRETFEWAGVYEPGKLAHTLRHSVATELLASGVDLEVVRDVLGHSSITTTALYLHAVDERKRQAARRLKLV